MSAEDQTEVTVSLIPAIAGIDAAAWDACANPDAARFNPFISHAFLKALETSGAVGPGTGWIPHHIVVPAATGTALAVAPCYLKGHSQGEYVFDHGWADAYERAGGRYYPKLQIAVPFTPVPGPRLLTRPGAEHAANKHLTALTATAIAEKNGLSSVHITFLDAETQAALTPLGFLSRTGQQFQWSNHGYQTFEDFLGTFASRKRKAVKKERSEALSDGIDVVRVTGSDITEAHWDHMFAFYIETGSRKWGRPYLNRRFFSELGAAMAERCLLIFARRDGELIAGALHMIGGDCLYGRYWGATTYQPSLHFELCYYQAIDYAIANRLTRVEAGAQGEHKLARGYLPVETHSAHWIADPGLRRAVQRFLAEERTLIKADNADLTESGPYRKDIARQLAWERE